MGKILVSGKRLNQGVRWPGEKPSWGETRSIGTGGSHPGQESGSVSGGEAWWWLGLKEIVTEQIGDKDFAMVIVWTCLKGAVFDILMRALACGWVSWSWVPVTGYRSCNWKWGGQRGRMGDCKWICWKKATLKAAQSMTWSSKCCNILMSLRKPVLRRMC